jgi:hypothetical protein
MIVTFYIFISWLLIGLFIFNKIQQHASLNEVTLLILLSCLINTHTYVGLFDTFKWMKTTTDTELFIGVLIYKNVFVPLLLTCFTFLIKRNPWNKKILYFIFFSLIILSVDFINVFQGLYSFKHWNHFYTFLYLSFLLCGLLVTLKWFRGLDSSSGGENNVVD